MTKKMTKEEYERLQMNRFIAENASLWYDAEKKIAHAEVYFNDERVEKALSKGYGFED